MKKSLTFTLGIVTIFLFCAPYLYAADEVHLISIDDALKTNRNLFNSDIKLSFSSEAPVNIIQDKGYFVSNKKTNAFLKSVIESCNRAFASAIISLQDRAVIEGGNAVINIHSFYKKREMFSESVFECHKGSIMSGVALKGKVVRVDN